MRRNLLVIVVLVFVLSACGAPLAPTLENTITPAAAINPTNTSHPAIPTASSTPLVNTPSASPTPLLFTNPSIPLSERIIYYYFVPPAENPLPEGSVTISSTYTLAPMFSDMTFSPDTGDNLRTALEIVLNDTRNGWISSNLKIVDLTFDGAGAIVILQGDYFGAGDVTLIAARMQILMTVFANPTVQSATVTLNGDTIGNLGLSNSMDAKPANYVFTRAEIETFISEHAHVPPSEPLQTGTSMPSTWEIFTNENAGFLLEHPAAWLVSGSDTQSGFIGRQVFWWTADYNPLEQRGDVPAVDQTTETEMGGQPATRVLGHYLGAMGDMGFQQYLRYIIKKGDVFYTFTLYAVDAVGVPSSMLTETLPLQEHDIALFEKMMATLKFKN